LDGTVTQNGSPFFTVASGATYPLITRLDGANSLGSFNAGTKTLSFTSNPSNLQINGAQSEIIPGNSTFNLLAKLDGVAGGVYNAGLDTLNFTTTPAILQRNAIQIKTLANASTFNLITKLDGAANNGTWDGVDTLDFTSAACSPVTFQINAVNKESLSSGSTFNLITKLDGAVNSGTYDAPTDTLSFTSAGGWQRPSYWRTLPTLTAASEAGYILLFVYENRLNQFTLQIPHGAVDWGDGTTSSPSGAVKTKTYTYSTIAQTVFVDPITGENYKQVIIGITRTGAAITYVDFTVAAATLPNIAPQFAVDYNLSFPNCTELILGGVFQREPRYAQILKIWALGTLGGNLRIFNAVNLKILQFPTTFSGNFNGRFAARIGAVDFPDFNTGTAINCYQLVSAAYILSHGNLIANSATSLGYYANSCPLLSRFGSVTANICTTINNAWEGCSAMTSIGLLTIPLCTDYSSAFGECNSLLAIRVANAAACTNTANMIIRCYSLQVLDMPNLTRGVNLTNTSMGNYGMNIFANGIGTASGVQTITITGTPFGALVTASDATALAIRAVMTGKGYTIAN
jgi:hypothetical protein